MCVRVIGCQVQLLFMYIYFDRGEANKYYRTCIYGNKMYMRPEAHFSLTFLHYPVLND